MLADVYLIIHKISITIYTKFSSYRTMPKCLKWYLSHRECIKGVIIITSYDFNIISIRQMRDAWIESFPRIYLKKYTFILTTSNWLLILFFSLIFHIKLHNDRRLRTRTTPTRTTLLLNGLKSRKRHLLSF